MRKVTLIVAMLVAMLLARTAAADGWSSLAFLEGTWTATGTGAGASATGTYTFVRELGGHVLARHSTRAGCKGPKAFDCEHSDLLYIYEQPPGQPLKALYLDNEGHVIHYDVTATATTATFVSEPGPGPAFRLIYERAGATMAGKFQMQPPGGKDWTSYLEWTGVKK